MCCGITPTPPEPKLLRTAMGAAAYVQHSHEGSTLEAVRCKFPGWPNPSVLRPRSDVLAAQRVVGVKRVVGATQLIFRG